MSEQVVEICAGAGGQALGLEAAGFGHALAVELDAWPVATLRSNRPHWDVRQGDVADPAVWRPGDFEGVDLLAGGVPCPPFSVAGHQRGANDERDLFAWAVEMAGVVKPRALMLENVRGLSMPRFAAYRQAVLDRLEDLGYVADWKLLQASDYGVPQLRPRFILVALRPEEAPFFHWPAETPDTPTVGETLRDLMAANGWPYADEWAASAAGIGPTVVGGSKKHGGADLGPTRARLAWSKLHVDGRGVADSAPLDGDPHFGIKPPRLTVEMVARLQGWTAADDWQFSGRKTAQYRQIGNAFPPPLAKRVGSSLLRALRREATTQHHPEPSQEFVLHDPVYRALRSTETSMSASDLEQLLSDVLTPMQIARSLENIASDFDLQVVGSGVGARYRLAEFRAFRGQGSHTRHEVFSDPGRRSRVS